MRQPSANSGCEQLQQTAELFDHLVGNWNSWFLKVVYLTCERNRSKCGSLAKKPLGLE